MRIAIVSPYDLTVAGGVQVHVGALAAALRAVGDEVHVVGPGLGPEGLGGSVSVPANGSRAPIALDPRVIFRTRAALRSIDADVVHVHEPLVPHVGPAAVLAARAPVVVTFHASAEAGLLPSLYRAARAPGRFVIARAAALTAVSPVAAAFHARALGLAPGRLIIIPNGVDLARFAPGPDHAGPDHAGPGPGMVGAAPDTTAGSSADAPVVTRVVFLGRLEHRKGADLAVRAFLQLAGRRPELQLQVLGDGPQAATLRALVAAAPAAVRARIQLLGRVQTEALPGLLSAADVVLLPSRGGESFGLVLLEAMAAGAVLVAADIAGYRDVARDDVEAVLVRPDDADALASALDGLLADPERRLRLREAGLRRAAEFDWSVVARSVREVYARVVSGAVSGHEAGGDRPDR